MKTTELVRGITALALCALLLPTTAWAKTKTRVTVTGGGDTLVDPGTMITDGKSIFLTGAVFDADRIASDPRLCVTGTIWADGILDLETGAQTLWGRFHLGNDRGAWDGYWQNKDGSMMITGQGSGGYAGLVLRVGSDAEGIYIVENGPGEVPFRVAGWRDEQIQWITGVVLTGPRVGQSERVGKVALVEGGGTATHTGVVTDQMEVGLLTFTSPTTITATITGTAKAANGDLLNWVAVFEMNLQMDLQTGWAEPTVHWAGGTGRFEAVTGSFSGKVAEQIDPATGEGSYWYNATGTIRY
jgi:hypothetical protein